MAIRYRKFKPTEYVIKVKNGNVEAKGLGLALLYSSRRSSIIRIPTTAMEVGFTYDEILTNDFQRINVQGDLSYVIEDYDRISKVVDYTYQENEVQYQQTCREAAAAIAKQLLNITKVHTTKFISGRDVRSVVRCANELADILKDAFEADETLKCFGIRIINVSVLAITPQIETRKALEAATREEILRQQDDAIYLRRNAAIEQERKIKENELDTEIKVAEKDKQRREKEMETRKMLQEREASLAAEKVKNDIALEEERGKLVDLTTENERKQSDAKAYDMQVLMKVFDTMDPNVVNALAMSGMDARALIAKAFVEIGDKAEKIGTLNVSPELLEALTAQR
ncbi:MAG: hypothetical protein K6F16_06735 [Lachnospiraceae bacterium]|nr:hypothetical protein [Lachnospiraceae bacterium]